MTTFTGVEDYVPSTNKRRPAFGLIDKDPDMVLVFNPATPKNVQAAVLNKVEERFTGSANIREVSAFVTEVLDTLVAENKLKRNRFNNQWVCLDNRGPYEEN